MLDEKKLGEPLDDMDLDKAVGGMGRWDEEIEFVCKTCKKTFMAKVKPEYCPNMSCGAKL